MREPRVVVIGGGAAGISATISAARIGSCVHLIERRSSIGGTVVHSLIHTLGGLYDGESRLVNPGLPSELIDRLRGHDSGARMRRISRLSVLSVDPAAYQRAVTEWLHELPGVAVHTGTSLRSVTMRGNRAGGVELEGTGGRGFLECDILIDASGTAAAIRMIPGARVREMDPPPAAGRIAVVGGIQPERLRFPAGAALIRHLRHIAGNGQGAPAFRTLWVDLGPGPDEASFKWTVPPGTEGGVTDADALITHLRNLPGFRDVHLRRLGRRGFRHGGSILGEYTLTANDLRANRRFADAACRGSWPIEFWDARGTVTVEYLPGDGTYDIPLGSLKVAGLSNVWAAGMCLSAEPLAQASARVVGTCWAMGEAAARAAVGSLR